MSYVSGKPLRFMSPRSSSTVLGYRKPSVVIRSTLGWSGHCASSAWRMRAKVLLPTATLPAMPMTYGTFGAIVPRNVADTLWRSWVALTYRFSSRLSGRYTVGDLVQVDAVVDAAQLLEVGLLEGQRRRCAQV